MERRLSAAKSYWRAKDTKTKPNLHMLNKVDQIGTCCSRKWLFVYNIFVEIAQPPLNTNYYYQETQSTQLLCAADVSHFPGNANRCFVLGFFFLKFKHMSIHLYFHHSNATVSNKLGIWIGILKACSKYRKTDLVYINGVLSGTLGLGGQQSWNPLNFNLNCTNLWPSQSLVTTIRKQNNFCTYFLCFWNSKITFILTTSKLGSL